MNFNSHIRDVPNFPKPGILFKDITPLLGHGPALAQVIADMAALWSDHQPTHVVGIESRGFIVGTGVALALNIGFVPVRKPGKLPAAVHRVDYDLEYGNDTLEIHIDALQPEDRVIIVDDVLATGGTMACCENLVAHCGATVIGSCCLIELANLGGRQRLKSPFRSLLSFD